MAKKNKHYFILAPGASVFWDPTTQTKILATEAKHPDEYDGPISPRMDLALRGKHIIEVDEPEPSPEVVTKKVKPSKAAPEPIEDEEPDEEDEDDEDGEEEQDKEPEEEEADPADGVDLAAKTDEELISFYKETYTVTPKDIKAFTKMTKEQKLKFLAD